MRHVLLLHQRSKYSTQFMNHCLRKFFFKKRLNLVFYFVFGAPNRPNFNPSAHGCLKAASMGLLSAILLLRPLLSVVRSVCQKRSQPAVLNVCLYTFQCPVLPMWTLAEGGKKNPPEEARFVPFACSLRNEIKLHLYGCVRLLVGDWRWIIWWWIIWKQLISYECTKRMAWHKWNYTALP